MVWSGRTLSISSGKRTRDWATKPWGVEETKSSHFLTPQRAPPPSPFHVPLARDFSRYPLIKWRASLLAGCYGFYFCERWLHRHHNDSVNCKRNHTPKSICKVLTSLLALDIWAKADKIAQTQTVAKPFNFNNFWRFISNRRKKSLRF